MRFSSRPQSRLASLLSIAWTVAWLPLSSAQAAPRPETYWRVDDVRAGMKGHGLTVMKGTRIEPFQAEVLGVLKNTSPGRDLVLCRLSGLDLDRTGVVSARSAWNGLHLIKLTGSSFAGFVRDEYTTLPEAEDRPLFVHMNIGWRNADFADRAPGEEVRDVAVSTFCDVTSASIQELVHQIGVQLLERFPQIATVDFYAENRLWDTAQTGERAAVYTDARPPFGVITLTLER